MIPFNKPPVTGYEAQFVSEALRSSQISGNGVFTKKCQHWFEKELGASMALLTPSCTHALEMAAMLLGIQEGDEVIMPSYTFVSTANAFALRGAKIVFVDIREDTLNIDERKIESAITEKTRAIVPVHYAGIACEMDQILKIAEANNLFVVEDAAQGISSKYKGRPLGTIGHLGTFSFHETKNISSGGEGGLLIVNDDQFAERAEVIREKGTNRSKFFKGYIDKYSWVDLGSSYLLNDISAAYLWAQLNHVDDIRSDRLNSWCIYQRLLLGLEDAGHIELPSVPVDCEHNGHLFYIKVSDLNVRTSLLDYMREREVMAVFHYVPLHSSEAGRKYARFHGEDRFTTKESERLIRLPLYYDIGTETLEHIAAMVGDFFR